jgi:hypothetical protein
MLLREASINKKRIVPIQNLKAILCNLWDLMKPNILKDHKEDRCITYIIIKYPQKAG